MSFKAAALAALAVLLAGAGLAYYYAGQEPGPLVKIEKPAAIGGGPVAIDVTIDSLGTKLRRLDVSLLSGLPLVLMVGRARLAWLSPISIAVGSDGINRNEKPQV